jgi:CheY-like chemotaxis protein
MGEQGGVENNSPIAVIGGGVAGAGMAAALLQAARSRGRIVDVRVYGHHRDQEAGAPAILTPECRSRLTALGCRVPADWRQVELRGFEIVAAGKRELLSAPPNGLWVVDDWPLGESGQRKVSDALAEAAAAHGAKFYSRRVDHVHFQPPTPGGPVSLRPVKGDLVIRAQGHSERVCAAVLATGATSNLGDAFFPGFEPAPTMPAVQARLKYPGLRHREIPLARLLLNPLPGVDGLYVIPCAQSVYVIAFGPTIEPADLCQALMMAARDGYVAEGFELSDLTTTRVPCGIGKKLVGSGRLAVGPAAMGHPLQLGIADTLSTCTRAAVALVEAGTRPRELERRYVTEGIVDLLEDTVAGSRAVSWLRHAGSRAARAFSKARGNAQTTPFAAGVLGLPSPTPEQLLRASRRAGIAEWVGSIFRNPIELPASTLEVEPDLYYVVDDDPESRELLTQYLESQGAEVVSFADELALFCAVARRPPTAVLLDVVLNWVDGLRLCEGLKQHPLTRDTEVIVMSGLSRPHVRERALRAGALAFLPKPFDPELMWKILGGRYRPQPVAQKPAAAVGANETLEPSSAAL